MMLVSDHGVSVAKDERIPERVVLTGVDIESVSRVRAAAERESFLKRIFTSGELVYARGKKSPERHLAGRFAAKEACAKALGTGFTSGVGLKDIEVVRIAGQSPSLRLHGGAGMLLGDRSAHLSISYESDLAVAVVLIE